MSDMINKIATAAAAISNQRRTMVLTFPVNIKQIGENQIEVPCAQAGPVFSDEFAERLTRELGLIEATRLLDEAAHRLNLQAFFAQVH